MWRCTGPVRIRGTRRANRLNGTRRADRIVAGLGGGLEYTVPTQSFPTQELPASVYADRGLHPRILLGLGVAFD